MKKIRTTNDPLVIETRHPFEGLQDGDERMAKLRLAVRINDHLRERGIKQREAALLLGITQPEVSSLGTGRLGSFTFDRLYRCLNALNLDVEISIKSHPRRAKIPAGIHVQG